MKKYGQNLHKIKQYCVHVNFPILKIILWLYKIIFLFFRKYTLKYWGREKERKSERENDKANMINVNIWGKRIFCAILHALRLYEKT